MAAAAVGDDDALASVTALSRKAAVLSRTGHFARAAEKYAAAATAAQSLAQPDCLIVAYLQLEETTALYLHARECQTLADAAAAFERVYCILLPSMMAPLQRRKAAGTLLPGACRAREAAFFGDVQQSSVVMKGGRPFEPAFQAAVGSLIGYETFLSAANLPLTWLMLPFTSLSRIPHPMITDAQFTAQHAFLLSALELASQPRVLNSVYMGGEAGLLDKCKVVTSNAVIMNELLPPDWAQTLRDALQRLERNGKMHQRGMEEGLAITVHDLSAARDTAAAEAAAHGLRCCALSSCGAREAHASHYKLCAACKTVVYCSKAHQAEDWPAHKRACKATRKAAAAAAAADAGGASGA
jgi:hypothetical protein